MQKKHIQFFGTAESCEKARLLLENHPQIKRIDQSGMRRTWTLLLYENISEMKLIPLLAKSGINGWRYF